MRNFIWKKLIFVVMAMVILASITGCEAKKNNRGISSETKNLIYSGKSLIMDGVQGTPVLYIVQDAKVYIETRDENESVTDESSADGEEEEPVIRLYSMNTDGEDIEELDLDLTEEFSDFVMCQDGSIVYLNITYDGNTEKDTVELVKKGADGKEIIRENLSESLDLGQYRVINGLKTDSKGNIFVLGKKKVFILDENLSFIGEIKSEADDLIGIALTQSGQVVCAQSTHAEGKTTTQAHILDVDGRKWGEEYFLEDVSVSSEGDFLMDGFGDYDFYYRDDTGIYGYDIEKKAKTKVMDFMASNISTEYTSGIIPTGDGRYIGSTSTYKSNMGNTGLVIYSKVDPDTITEKKIITYGGIGIDDTIKQAAIEFNKENKDYQIEFQDYAYEEDPSAKMTADILAGNVPDIIDLQWVSVDQYIAKGLLEDLTPYFEKDSEIHKEDVIPAVWDAMETEGKHYYISSGFFLYSLIGKSKDVGTGSGWTYEELKEILEKKGKETQLLSSKNKTDLLSTLLCVGVTDFVDWNTGECSFDSEEFKELLEICNEYGIEEKGEDTPSDLELFEQEKRLLLNLDESINLDVFLMMDEIFGEDIHYIGYPNKDKQGTYFSFVNRISMYAKSDVKEGAWEFIRTFMTKEYQGNPKFVDYGDIPTRQDCFDLEIEAAMATKEYTNEMGIDITPRFCTNEYDGIEYEVKPMTQEQENLFRELINSTKCCEQYNDVILGVIEEESKRYFAAEKSLDETVNIIQNRVTTYVNENR